MGLKETPTRLDYACGHCREAVSTYWRDQGLLNGEYVLFGEVFFHNDCLDEYLKEFPLSDC